MSAVNTKKPNRLIKETSPYLLQHAYNPVDWLPFTEEAFAIAKRENKPVLISIGYSACHWCHVMEHESFEDEQVAALMNKNFVNIKVDREERSDVDMIYMHAVQLMTGHGGWPLNCFVLPDGRPFYGGTYFPKSQWLNILENLYALYVNEPQKVNEYATELTKGIQQGELIGSGEKTELPINKNLLRDSVSRWKKRMDNVEGGPNKAPKFPLPSNYLFLLRYSILEKDEELLKHVELTLRKMAFGGIYDQLHGGFSRYSTDTLWKVPHFEKMLYDNSQLVSLYFEAFTLTQNSLYKNIAIDTLKFVEREWLNSEGCFYSAYDADSDGEEGKYYVWSKEDLVDLLGDKYDLFSRYFLINDIGYWEHGNYILMRNENYAQVLSESGISAAELDEKIEACKEILKQEAKSRIKPGLDDKTITSWNAMMCSAYAKGYLVTGEKKYKEIALRSIHFITEKLSMGGGKLFRTYKNGESKIEGFLEDYAFTIEALINCHLISQDETFLRQANEMTSLALKLFHNEKSDFLYYTSHDSPALISKSMETSDNVIPASNSQMAHNLFVLGKYFDNSGWIERSGKMLGLVAEELKNYGSAYSHWGSLGLYMNYPFREVAIVGKDVDEKLSALYKHGVTNTIFAVSNRSSELPLVKDRFVEDQTMIYVCENKSCRLPVKSVEEAIKQLA